MSKSLIEAGPNTVFAELSDIPGHLDTSGYLVEFVLSNSREINTNGEGDITINGTDVYSADYLSAQLSPSSALIQPQIGYFIVRGVSNFMVERNHAASTIMMNGTPIQFDTTIQVSSDSIVRIDYNTCLSVDTIIMMADGTGKRIDDIYVGDKVLTPFGCDTVSEHYCGHGNSMDIWKFDDGTEIKTVGRHRFFNCELQEPMYLEAWNIGESGLRHDGKRAALIAHERVESEVRHATLFTEKYNLYYANGILSGNRKSVCYKEA